MDNATIALIIRGIIALVLAFGGVYALRKGFQLLKDGKGLKPEANKIEFLGMKASLGSLGALGMLTAFMWGWAAERSLPNFSKTEDGVMVSALKLKIADKNTQIAELSKNLEFRSILFESANTELVAALKASNANVIAAFKDDSKLVAIKSILSEQEKLASSIGKAHVARDPKLLKVEFKRMRIANDRLRKVIP